MKPKIYLIAAALLLSAAFTSCKKDDDKKNVDDTDYVMTMTSQKEGYARIILRGQGTITIDWGDDTGIESVTFPESSYRSAFEHYYSGKNDRTITITGHVTRLDCPYNQLKSLDVSKNPALIWMECYGNQLTNLKVNGAIALTNLLCDSNQLTGLDVSGATALEELNCRSNQFTAAGLNALFDTLHDNIVDYGGKNVYIGDNEGTNSCSPSIAIEKRWKVNY